MVPALSHKQNDGSSNLSPATIKEIADSTFNAANNIKNRVLVTVLRDMLLKQMDNGAYEPKNLKREKVKELLLSFRRSPQNIGSECGECSMTTFDYV